MLPQCCDEILQNSCFDNHSKNATSHFNWLGEKPDPSNLFLAVKWKNTVLGANAQVLAGGAARWSRWGEVGTALLWWHSFATPVLDTAGSNRQTQGIAEPLSQDSGTSGKAYLRKGKNKPKPHETQRGGGKRKSRRNSSTNTKVREGRGGGALLHYSRYLHYSPWRSPRQSRWILLKELWPMESPHQSRGNVRRKEQQRGITVYWL